MDRLKEAIGMLAISAMFALLSPVALVSPSTARGFLERVNAKMAEGQKGASRGQDVSNSSTSGTRIDNRKIASFLSRAANGEGQMDDEGLIRIDGWQIMLFVDAGDVDYVEAVLAPDGSNADYGSLSEADSSDAVDLLSAVDRESLNRRIDSIG